MSNFKVILSDLDGVIRNYPSYHSSETENELGLESGRLLPVAFQKKFLEPVITGLITDEEWRQKIVEELSLRFNKEMVGQAICKWSAFPGVLDEDVVNIYKSVKGNYKIALLSNASSNVSIRLKKNFTFCRRNFVCR